MHLLEDNLSSLKLQCRRGKAELISVQDTAGARMGQPQQVKNSGGLDALEAPWPFVHLQASWAAFLPLAGISRQLTDRISTNL